MLRKVRIDQPGDTDLLPTELSGPPRLRGANNRVLAEGVAEPATAQAVLLGVTKASLNTARSPPTSRPRSHLTLCFLAHPRSRPTRSALVDTCRSAAQKATHSRVRSAPSINAEPLFLAFDAEVFVVQDGPQQADGYTWWYLAAPYDQTRTGWAASNFSNGYSQSIRSTVKSLKIEVIK